MAKQVGILKYSGNLGGISHYKISGLQGDFARVAIGPTAEQIATLPEFQRTRENNKEFGAAAMVGKSFRLGFSTETQNMGDRFITGRLTKIFREMCSESAGIRGQRPIEISQNKNKLKNFEFDKNLGFNTVFNIPYTVSTNTDRSEAIVVVDDANASNYIYSPAGSTHFRLLLTVVGLSDFVYDTNTSEYEAVNSNNAHGLKNTITSAYIPVNGQIGSVTTLISNLPTSGIVLQPEETLIVSLGIEFYQEVSGVQYLFAQGNCAQVVELF